MKATEANVKKAEELLKLKNPNRKQVRFLAAVLRKKELI